ncbi:MAG TPA: cysteine desulfurase family protein [Bacillota bacterium]|nr:cysteine desulfurase family protein [Bacillota bacterium]
MKAYLDNSATTFIAPEVLAELKRIYSQVPGNPSSLYSLGMEAEQELKRSRSIIAGFLGVQAKEIYFTSGGTEANNLAIRGAAAAYSRQGKHLVTTATEHPSVLNAFRALEEKGFQVTYLPCGREGRISACDLKEALREDTILVSTMFVNNEMGALTPLEELSQVLRERKQNLPLWHVDAVQGFGRLEVKPESLGIDLLSLSGHKIHAPKGVGVLYCRGGIQLEPLFYGGEQERALRPGTENVAGIAALAKAAELAFADREKDLERLEEFKEKLISCCKACGGVVNGPEGSAAVPYILNISFPGVPAEVLLHSLDAKGISVSTGSACSSRQKTPSHVLSAMGLDRNRIKSAIRMSLSRLTGKEEIDYACQVLPEVVAELRALYGARR